MKVIAIVGSRRRNSIRDYGYGQEGDQDGEAGHTTLGKESTMGVRTGQNYVRMCSKCGSPIQPERLEALPETRCCVGCSCVKCRSVLDVDLDGPELADMVQAVQGIGRGE